MKWRAWVTWDRIAAQEQRLHRLGSGPVVPIFECALSEPAKYATKAHAVGPDGHTLCGREIPEDNPDDIALWAGPEDGVQKCKRCVAKIPSAAPLGGGGWDR